MVNYMGWIYFIPRKVTNHNNAV